MFAEVVLNRPTHRRPPAGAEPVRGDSSRWQTYTYRVPTRLEETLLVGHLVQVPVKTGTALGVVVALADVQPAGLPPEEIRDLAEILDRLPVVTPSQLELARWIAREYVAPLSQALRLLLPPGIEERTTLVVTEAEGGGGAAEALPGDEARALRLLRRSGGRLRMSALEGALGVEDAGDAVQRLVERGLVQSRFALVPPKPFAARIRYASLLADDETLRAESLRLGRPSKQADVLLALARRVEAPVVLPELCEEAGCSAAPVEALARKGWVKIVRASTLVLGLPEAVQDLSRAEGAPQQRAVLEALRASEGPVDWEDLRRQTGASMQTLAELERKGLVRWVSEPAVVLPRLTREQATERALALRGGERERAVLHELQGSSGRVWVGGLYAQTGASLETLRRLAERGLIALHGEASERRRPDVLDALPVLGRDQAAVLEEIVGGLGWQARGDRAFVALLHGVTGSGKTEVYLRAIRAVLDAGQRAIVLVPEISLTAQTVRRFEARFPGHVALLHSQLSLGQRYQVWDQARRGEVDILIGPRSALLAPVSRLGLIVVDEAHDPSFKQDEPIPLPPYHACDAAVALGRNTGAAVVLGTATPEVSMHLRASEGTYRLLRLPERIVPVAASLQASRASAPPATAALPSVRVVDLRQELFAGNRSIFSRALRSALEETLRVREQAILYLNRRGSATFVLCRECGSVASCPRCELPLTYHRPVVRPTGASGEAEEMVCHRCNRRERVPSRCPACGGRRIRFFGLGTERVEAEVRAAFPEARVLRWDRDTAMGLNHERHLQAFVEHQADVLVGTQMIAKGLDLPLVTLVGVVSADTALHLPDLRAAERTYQLLEQVAGRAGRSQRGGRVIVQTYHPEHYAIQAAARHDYSSFYEQELVHRRRLGYPPFRRLVALRYSDPDARRCQAEAERMGRWLAAEVRRLGQTVQIIGPAPCFFRRLQGRSRWQILLRSVDPRQLLEDVALPWGWRVDVDPVSLL